MPNANSARMLRVYLAGPISSKDPHEVLWNLGQGIEEGGRLFHMGVSPFVPHLNYHFSFHYRHDNDTYYEADNVWLEVSDAVVLLPGWAKSRGAKAEKALADKLGIPVFLTVQKFINALRRGAVKPRKLVEERA